MDFINANAYAGTKLKVVSNLYYPGYAADNVQPVVIILHLVVFGSPLLLGLYYFLRSGFSVARLRELVAAEEAQAQAEGRAGESKTAGAARAANA